MSHHVWKVRLCSRDATLLEARAGDTLVSHNYYTIGQRPSVP